MIKFKQKLTTFLGFYIFKKDMLLVSFCIGFNKNEMRKIEGEGGQRNKCRGYVPLALVVLKIQRDLKSRPCGHMHSLKNNRIVPVKTVWAISPMSKCHLSFSPGTPETERESPRAEPACPH